jgi:hypothetical protein
MHRNASRAPRFAVTAIECFERPVTLRLPFRFGAATLHEATQALVRASIRATDGRTAQGMAAELMVPKWFDKDPQKSDARNTDDLRLALRLAGAAYPAHSAPRSAFGHASFHYQALLDEGARAGLNALTASYGAALVDRALLDALCRLRNVSFGTALWLNLPGIDASLTPDLAHFDLDAFLATLEMRSRIDARHTVGIADPLTDDDRDAEADPDDGLPVTLTDVIARYHHRYFKLKLCGRVEEDVARLARIAGVLDRLTDYRVTLDGNEQFADVAAVSEFVGALGADPRLARLASAVLYLEQPLPRTLALDSGVQDVPPPIPLIIDESDATIDAFPQARMLGYAGVSSKSCKGVYKSLLNAARCARWNGAGGDERAMFMTGEDLTAQAGLALQQDLALAGLLGLAHVERNGHHYVAGFAGQHAPIREQRRFLGAHPTLYKRVGEFVAVAIRDGQLALDSLAVIGFASAAWPDIESLRPLRAPSREVGDPSTGTLNPQES